MRTLRATLPPPLTDSPDALRHRDHAAIARIASLCPSNAAEADTAALYVAASEQWKDCLRLAQLPETTPQWAMKCRAQAISMMRQSQGALRILLRMQAVREKRESTNQSRDRAAFTEQAAMDLMLEALESPPPGVGLPSEPAPQDHPRGAEQSHGSPVLLPLTMPETARRNSLSPAGHGFESTKLPSDHISYPYHEPQPGRPNGHDGTHPGETIRPLSRH